MLKRIGIFGGSFDPIHIGHVKLAKYIVDEGLVDEVWLMVSPLNPLKVNGRQLTSDVERIEMVRLAIEDIPGLRASDFEFSLPKPSYSAATLRALSAAYPDCEFRLIIGADNWAVFDRWREPDFIIEHFAPIIYPRPGVTLESSLRSDHSPDISLRVAPSSLIPRPSSLLNGAPQTDISSTELREMIRRHDPKAADYIPAKTLQYIRNHHLYE